MSSEVNPHTGYLEIDIPDLDPNRTMEDAVKNLTLMLGSQNPSFQKKKLNEILNIPSLQHLREQFSVILQYSGSNPEDYVPVYRAQIEESNQMFERFFEQNSLALRSLVEKYEAHKDLVQEGGHKKAKQKLQQDMEFRIQMLEK